MPRLRVGDSPRREGRKDVEGSNGAGKRGVDDPPDKNAGGDKMKDAAAAGGRVDWRRGLRVWRRARLRPPLAPASLSVQLRRRQT